VKNRLTSETNDLKAEMANLEKKADYLEKTYQNSKASLEQVLRGGA